MAKVEIGHTHTARRANPASANPWAAAAKARPAKPKALPQRVEISHENKRTSVTPVARNSRSGVQARTAAGIRGFSGDENRKTPRRLNLGKFGFHPKAPNGYQHVLMGEMIAAFVIIAIRAIADYSPSTDLHSAGTEKPSKGASPISLIAATIAAYFVLAFLATRGGWPARIASAFGLLMIIALMINSQAELAEVAGWIEGISTNNAQQTAPSSAPVGAGLGGPNGNGPNIGPSLPDTGQKGAAGGLAPVGAK